MINNTAAVIKNNVVANTVIIPWAIIPDFKEGKDFDGDDLIPIDNTVAIGDSYDPDTGIFTRDGVRVYPEKTVEERLSEMETKLLNTQLALCEIYERMEG